jgi:uncharacterized protein
MLGISAFETGNIAATLLRLLCCQPRSGLMRPVGTKGTVPASIRVGAGLLGAAASAVCVLLSDGRLGHAGIVSNEQTWADDALPVSASWAHLRGAAVGRLAVVVDGRPDIFPVNFLVDHGSVVFRTAAGTKLDAAVGQAVAFEADGYETDAGEAWSVVVKGTAREVEEIDEVIAALELPLSPWHSSRKPRIIRIVPEDISGRRFKVRPDVRRAARPRTAPE